MRFMGGTIDCGAGLGRISHENVARQGRQIVAQRVSAGFACERGAAPKGGASRPAYEPGAAPLRGWRRIWRHISQDFRPGLRAAAPAALYGRRGQIKSL